MYILTFAMCLLSAILIIPSAEVDKEVIASHLEYKETERDCYFLVQDVKPLIFEDGSKGYILSITGGSSSVKVDIETEPPEQDTQFKGSERILTAIYETQVINTCTIPIFYYSKPDIKGLQADFKEKLVDTLYTQEQERRNKVYTCTLYITTCVIFVVLLLIFYIIYNIKYVKYTRYITKMKMKD